MQIEKRLEERDDCNLAASLFVGLDRKAIPCTIENISERGARICIDPSIILPDFFALVLPALDGFSHLRAVQLRWQVGEVAGVRFSL